MELDLQSLFGLHVHGCTHWRRPRNPPSPHAFRLIFEGAIGQPRWTTSLCDHLILANKTDTFKSTTYNVLTVCNAVPLTKFIYLLVFALRTRKRNIGEKAWNLSGVYRRGQQCYLPKKLKDIEAKYDLFIVLEFFATKFEALHYSPCC
jgi:hypothetical protein